LGGCFFVLPRHVQRLVVNIPPSQLPNDWYTTAHVDIIVATDVSVLFGVGCHSCILAFDNKEIITSGGGPDGGASAYMTSYRSELGSIKGWRLSVCYIGQDWHASATSSVYVIAVQPS
jgi:hypothetical protein